MGNYTLITNKQINTKRSYKLYNRIISTILKVLMIAKSGNLINNKGNI